jgi:hypothetical protein
MRAPPTQLTHVRPLAVRSDAHSAEVKGDQRLSVIVSADSGQNRLGKACPAIGYGVADRRVKVHITGHEILPIAVRQLTRENHR